LDEDDLPMDLDSHIRHLFRTGNPNLAPYFENLYAKSYVSGRLGLVSARLNDQNRSERVAFLVVGQSSIDGARSESFYSGVGALVWAMPGLGFMGTAFEMAGAVGGMGASLTGTSDYLGLRNLLVTSVIPHLAGAFDITLFALGGSVFTFMFLTLVRR